MACCHPGLLSLVWIVLLVSRVAPQSLIEVPENTKDVFLFTQIFNLPGVTCNQIKVSEIQHESYGPLLNWTSPVQIAGVQTYTTNVSLIKSLDYEKVTLVIVQLQVTFTCDGGGEERINLPGRQISVTDEFDSKPEFTQDRFEVMIPENLPVNTTIIYSITAKDPDSGDFIRYSLQIPENDRDMFTGVPTVRFIEGSYRDVFDILLAQSLDYEDVTRYKFQVIVMDSMNFSSYCDVTVQVIDVQDTPPAFTLPIYSGRVDEMAPQGTSVTQVVAVDKDGELVRNNITYSIITGLTDAFDVDNVTGVIFTKRLLDIDGDNAIGFNGLLILTVQANELNTSGEVQYGKTTDTARVQIQIDDANDHPPIFSSPTYSGSIRAEAVAGEIVAIDRGGYISVTDQDQAPSNNHFSLHIERDGSPWSAFETNVRSQFVQASVLVVLKEPDAIKELDNTHIRFQLVATDLSSDVSMMSNGNNTSSVADIIVFVLPQASAVPPPEPIVDLPISTSDVIVFVMGFLLLLNIILTVIICRLLHRSGQGGLGLFRRNSKYYVSERKRNEIGGVRRINDLTQKNNQETIQTAASSSSSAADAKHSDTLALTEAAINRNIEVRNTVSSAANRNRCDVTLLHEIEEGRTATTAMNSVDGITNQSNGNRPDHRNQTDRCDVTPLPRQDVRKRSQQHTSPLESGSQNTTPQFSSNPEGDLNKCDVIPLETSLASKNKTLSNLLERVQQKLTAGGNRQLETCDLRPLHEDNPSPDASLTEATNSNNSSFSERTKCDVAPLINAAGKSKPERHTKTVNPSQVNVAFLPEEEDTLKASDRGKDIPQNDGKPIKAAASFPPKKVTLIEDKTKGQAVPQFIPTLSPSQSQITQTGVPPVALALPFGSNTKPKPKDDNGGMETTVINPVYNEEIVSKPNIAMKKTVENSNKNSLIASGSQDQKNKRPHAAGNTNEIGIHQVTRPSVHSDTQAKDYVEAAKSLLNSATLKKTERK